jgi:hypothetical protein
MPYSDYTPETIVACGDAIYQQQRSEIEPQHNGKFWVVDIDTGDYEIDDKDFVAASRLRARHPNPVIYCTRIGCRTANQLGFRLSVSTDYPPGTVTARGEAVYQKLQNTVEPRHNGQFLVIDIQTEDYEIDARGTVAINRLLSKHPNAVIYVVRIGHQIAYQLGFRGTYGTLANKVTTNAKTLK